MGVCLSGPKATGSSGAPTRLRSPSIGVPRQKASSCHLFPGGRRPPRPDLCSGGFWGQAFRSARATAVFREQRGLAFRRWKRGTPNACASSSRVSGWRVSVRIDEMNTKVTGAWLGVADPGETKFIRRARRLFFRVRGDRVRRARGAPCPSPQEVTA